MATIGETHIENRERIQPNDTNNHGSAHGGNRTGERERTTDSRFVFVAIADDGSPVPVPDLTVGSERCEELRRAALDGERGQ